MAPGTTRELSQFRDDSAAYRLLVSKYDPDKDPDDLSLGYCEVEYIRGRRQTGPAANCVAFTAQQVPPCGPGIRPHHSRCGFRAFACGVWFSVHWSWRMIRRYGVRPAEADLTHDHAGLPS